MTLHTVNISPALLLNVEETISAIQPDLPPRLTTTSPLQQPGIRTSPEGSALTTGANKGGYNSFTIWMLNALLTTILP
ncbi:hypothetical protein E2C01_035006 [Portunus trituberculatus]|uniref:Uncharacterized protein n=1 Tax=Portunus trituberculatus TaxID=210409 RepID=A0A5B7F7A0_PORTR|nr:hypothetical protein [Portunus trituberculatus]